MEKSLWEQAYHELYKQKKALLDDYATIARSAGYKKDCAPLNEEMPKVLQDLIDVMRDKEFTISVGKKTVHVRDQIRKVVKLVLRLKDIGSAVASLDPVHAGLPWAGICLLLPLLENDETQSTAAMEGVEYIAVLIKQYEAVEDDFDGQSATDVNLKASILQLYMLILEYQAFAVGYFFKNTFKRYIQNTFKINDWTGLHQKIRDKDGEIKQLSIVRDNARLHRKFDDLLAMFQMQQLMPETVAPRITAESLPGIPFERDPDFIGRKEIIADLATGFETGRRMAIAGRAGIGKSQIAIEYAHRVKEASPETMLFWVRGASSETFDQSYSDIATSLRLVNPNESNAGINGLVSKYLAIPKNGNWLMILDNADDENVYNSSSKSKARNSYIPQAKHGSVLITSRNRNVARRLAFGQDRVVQVDAMSDEEALGLIVNKLQSQKSAKKISKNPEDSTKRIEKMKELVTELEYLPLAITQATAYILEQEWSVSKYLQRLREQAEDYLDKGLPDHRRDVDDDSSNSVLRTWRISFESIRETTPAAVTVLCLCSLVVGQGIPFDLLLQSVDRKSEDLDDALGILKRFELLKEEEKQEIELLDDDSSGSDDDLRDVTIPETKDDMVTENKSETSSIGDGKRTFQSHRLIQMATRAWLNTEDLLQVWKDKVLEIFISHATTSEEGNWEFWKEFWNKLLPHAEKILGYSYATKEASAKYGRLLFLVGAYQIFQGYFMEGYEKMEQACQYAEWDEKTRRSWLSAARENVAKYSIWKGDIDAAKTQARKLVQENNAVLGEDDYATRSSTQTLAGVLELADETEEAKALLDRLQVRNSELGKKDSVTVRVIGNLASIHAARGEYSAAAKEYANYVKAVKDLKGPDHISTLSAYNRLGNVLVNNQDIDGAEKVMKIAWQGRCRLLGKSHPDTCVSLLILARIHVKQKRNKLAERELSAVLRRLNARGVPIEHANMQLALGTKAALFDAQGKYQDAVDLTKDVLRMRENLLGPLHHETLIALNNLALYLLNIGDLASSEGALRKALRIYRETVSENSDGLRSFETNLAVLLAKRRKFAEAMTLAESSIARVEKAYDNIHREVLSTRRLFPHVLVEKGDFQEALRTNCRVLEVCEKQFGLFDYLTLTCVTLLTKILSTTEGYVDVPEDQEVRDQLVGRPLELTITMELVQNLPEYTELRYYWKQILVLMVQNVKIYESKFNIGSEQALAAQKLVADHLRMGNKNLLALEMYKEVLKHQEELLGPEDSATLLTSYELAETLRLLEYFEDAEARFRDVLKKREVIFGSNLQATLAAKSNLALVLNDQAKYKEAEQLMREVFDVRKNIFGLIHEDTLLSSGHLGLCLRSQGKWKLSEEFLVDSLHEYQSQVEQGYSHSKNGLSAMNELLLVLQDLKRYKEAAELGRRVYEARKSLYGENNLSTLLSQANLAFSLADLGPDYFEESEDMYRASLRSTQEMLPTNHSRTIDTREGLARLCGLRGQKAEALIEMRQVFFSRLESSKPDTLAVANTGWALSHLARELGKYWEAEAVLRGTLAIRRKVSPENHPKRIEAFHGYVVVLVTAWKEHQTK